MAAHWDWSDFWPRYKENPALLTEEMWLDMPRFLSQQSTRIQLEILSGAPDEIIKPLLRHLTFDCQIRLLYKK